MKPGSPTVKLTYEDLVAFPDDGKRHEIIDGEHYVTPSPNTRHQVILGSLHLALASFLRERRVGQVFLAPLDVLLSKHDIVEPDLFYVSNGRASVVGEKNVQGSPDLAIEILSPSTRRVDERVKRDLYDRAGVREYWVVDPELETVKVYRRTGERFDTPRELSAERNEILTSPLLPDWEASLSTIFE